MPADPRPPSPKATSHDCPAFKSGCPFPGQLQHNPELMVHAKKCPAFQSGCPFSTTSSFSDVSSLLKQIPATHKACPGFQEAISGAADGKGVVLCSNGKSFVDHVKTIRWDLFPLNDDEQPQLAADLKAGTKDAHTLAERAPFVHRFIKGNIDVVKYGHFLGNLYFVYCALEQQLRRHKDVPSIRPIYFPELERKESLEADLQYFLGDDWRLKIHCSPAGRAYVERIIELGKQNPPIGLVAHCYTRYLGDLSGGQILQRVAKKALGLKDSKGTEFYEFVDVLDHKMFKDVYRQRLSQLPITPAVADQVVAEANTAFELNVNIFVELDDDAVWEQLDKGRALGLAKPGSGPASQKGFSPLHILIVVLAALFAYQCMGCLTSKPHSFK